jgi:hypothetical protein
MKMPEKSINLEAKLFELIVPRSNVFKSIVFRPTSYRLIVLQNFLMDL